MFPLAIALHIGSMHNPGFLLAIALQSLSSFLQYVLSLSMNALHLAFVLSSFSHSSKFPVSNALRNACISFPLSRHCFVVSSMNFCLL